jgi:hypothetical protein
MPGTDDLKKLLDEIDEFIAGVGSTMLPSPSDINKATKYKTRLLNLANLRDDTSRASYNDTMSTLNDIIPSEPMDLSELSAGKRKKRKSKKIKSRKSRKSKKRKSNKRR